VRLGYELHWLWVTISGVVRKFRLTLFWHVVSYIPVSLSNASSDSHCSLWIFIQVVALSLSLIKIYPVTTFKNVEEVEIFKRVLLQCVGCFFVSPRQLFIISTASAVCKCSVRLSTQCSDAGGRRKLFTAAIVEKILKRWKTLLLVSILVTIYDHGLGRHKMTIYFHFYCFCLFNGKIKKFIWDIASKSIRDVIIGNPLIKVEFAMYFGWNWPEPK